MSLNSRIAAAVSKAVELLYIKPLEGFIPRHTFRYGVCGVANSIVLDSIFYYLIYHYIVGERVIDLGVVAISAHIASMILVFPITFLIGFWLNRFVAFGATKQKVNPQMGRYALSVAGSIVLSYVALKFLVEVCAIWPTPAKTLSSIIVAIYSYLAARYFTFGVAEKK